MTRANQSWLWMTIAAIVSVLLAATNVYGAVSSTLSIENVQRSVCVGNRCELRYSRVNRYGTAFTVGRIGGRDVWVSCGHAFPPGVRGFVGFGNQWVPVTLKGRVVDERRDLAVFEAPTNAVSHYRVGTGRMGDPVKMIGFPEGSQAAVATQTVIGRRTSQNASYLQIGSKAGMSGCPVIAENGECVGVVWGDDPGRGAIMTSGAELRLFLASIYGTADLLPSPTVPAAPGNDDTAPSDPQPGGVDASEFDRIASIAKRNRIAIEMMERQGSGSIKLIEQEINELKVQINSIDPNADWEPVDLGPLESKTEANRQSILELKQTTDRLLSVVEALSKDVSKIPTAEKVDLSGIESRLAALEKRTTVNAESLTGINSKLDLESSRLDLLEDRPVWVWLLDRDGNLIEKEEYYINKGEPIGLQFGKSYGRVNTAKVKQ